MTCKKKIVTLSTNTRFSVCIEKMGLGTSNKLSININKTSQLTACSSKEENLQIARTQRQLWTGAALKKKKKKLNLIFKKCNIYEASIEAFTHSPKLKCSTRSKSHVIAPIYMSEKFSLNNITDIVMPELWPKLYDLSLIWCAGDSNMVHCGIENIIFTIK